MTIRGVVVRGQGLGAKLGIPTANLKTDGSLPPNGVYAVVGRGPGLGERRGVCNIGVRPTVAGKSLVVEAHFPAFSGDLYGRELTLELLGRLRDEKKFPSLEDLKAQILLDIEAAASYPPPPGAVFNADGNLLGRVVAFLLLAGAVVWLGRFLGR